MSSTLESHVSTQALTAIRISPTATIRWPVSACFRSYRHFRLPGWSARTR